MKFGIQQRIRPYGIKPLLALLAVLSSSVVSEAGVIWTPIEIEPGAIVTASTAPLPDAPDEDPQFVQSCGQEFGMTSASSPPSSDIVVVSYFGRQSGQPELVQWLGTDCRLMLPVPIPISLLKVPIQVA